MEEVRKALYERLSNYFGESEELKNDIFNKEKQGAEDLLDWCRDDYETKEDTELDNIWNICNWYLDLLNGKVTEKWLLEMIKNY